MLAVQGENKISRPRPGGLLTEKKEDDNVEIRFELFLFVIFNKLSLNLKVIVWNGY